MGSSVRRLGKFVGAASALAVVAAMVLWAHSADDAAAPVSVEGELVVFKTPACRCCAAWAAHMAEADFRVRVEDRADLTALKRELNIPDNMYSCHTAILEERVIEGHVPAGAVRRYLAAASPGRGISVPGMPAGSPGMMMHGDRPRSYDVFVFDGAGRVEIFAER